MSTNDRPTPGPPGTPATQVVLLGTGTPVADPARSGPATAVVVGDVAYLVDLGPGVVRRAAAAHARGVTALAPERLTRAFVTHLHSDHTAGYADLILTPWTNGRTETLTVYGPAGLRAMTAHLLAAYATDIAVRRVAEPDAHAGVAVNAVEVGPGLAYRDKLVEVTAFPVEHGSWAQAFGYRFQTADRTVVISGDTRPSETLVEHSRGCDVLVHEVYSTAGFQQQPPGWQAYHSAFHTSAAELAELASRIRPGLLVLHHQLFWGTTEDELLAEVRSRYDGPVLCGADLDVI